MLIKAVTGLEVTCRQDNAPAHKTRETVQLLTHETPDFITPTLSPANSPDQWPHACVLPDLGKLHVTRADVWRRPSAEVEFYQRAGTFQPDDQLITNEAVTQSRSRLEACIWACEGSFELLLLHSTFTCLNIANSGHLMILGELAEVAVTFADVDRVYWNFFAIKCHIVGAEVG